MLLGVVTWENWYVLLMVFSGAIGGVHGAGVAMHALLASRALEIGDADLWGSVLAGAFYPDCFYNCLGLDDIGEYDHWTPFLYELVEHYNADPNPGLKAFIQGVFTHQLADITWHSLRLDEGLLKFMNNVEFGNSENFDNCHTFIDTGGDFVILQRLFGNLSEKAKERVSNLLKTPWNIPAKDLVQIYRRQGLWQVSEANLKYCMWRGHSALQAELSAIFNADPADYYIKKSPLFADILEEYYLGGIQEITYTVRTCLPNLELWFDHFDEIRDPRDVCDTFIGTTTAGSDDGAISVEKKDDDAYYLSTYMRGSQFGYNIALGSFLADGRECIAISAPYEFPDGSVYIFPLDELYVNGQFEALKVVSPTKERSLTYSPRFGTRLLTFMDEFLIVSSPGESTLKIFYLNDMILEIYSSESKNVIGSTGAMKQFGLLLELDGNNVDVVVGSKYSDYGSGKAAQRGVVFILDGGRIAQHIARVLANGGEGYAGERVEIRTLVKAVFELPEKLRQTSQYENFGSQYSGIDNYRAISAENLATVVVYHRDEPSWLITDDCDVSKYGTREVRKMKSESSGQFGGRAVEFFKHDQQVYLLICAKTQSDECPQCGACHIFLMSSSSRPRRVLTLVPGKSTKGGQFGANARLSKANGANVLLISDVTRIYKIILDDLIAQDAWDAVYTVGDRDVLVTGPAKIGYSGFGTNGIALAQQHGFLIVGMPYFGYSELGDADLELIGKVALIKSDLRAVNIGDHS